MRLGAHLTMDKTERTDPSKVAGEQLTVVPDCGAGIRYKGSSNSRQHYNKRQDTKNTRSMQQHDGTIARSIFNTVQYPVYHDGGQRAAA